MESEGRCRQISGLTNPKGLASRRRNHMRLCAGVRLPYKLKSNSYLEQHIINVADTRRERVRSYLGRSHGHGNLMYFIDMVETRSTIYKRLASIFQTGRHKGDIKKN